MIRVLILMLLPLATLSAHASLGEGTDTFEKDRAALGGTVMPAASSSSLPSSIRVYQMQVGAVTIKEFADASGQIFAISWRGTKYPKLDSLLGRFYAEYAGKQKTTPKGRRFPHHDINTDNVTVSFAGHAPFLFGSAILNGHLPAGVNPGDLQ